MSPLGAWPACSSLWVVCLLLSASSGVLGAPSGSSADAQCPGLPASRPAVCTDQCQAAICQSLSTLYRVSYNESRPWRLDTGWEITKTQSCQQIMVRAGRSPSYCSWYGITCCTPALMSKQQCSIINSVHNIKVVVNAMNASVADPQFLKPLVQLHSCGLTQLELQGNDLSGSITDGYKQLSELTVLDLSNNWLSGTIPEVLRTLTNLTLLGLGTNFLNGPIPSWLGDLKQLRTLNLGANQGGNPDETLGLTGSLPSSLGQLLQLEVLNLETNALAGTLPPRLCTPASNLRVLKLRGNMLSGDPAQLLSCHLLTQLDISNNDFSGQLPENGSWNWSQLAVLDASNNHLDGSFPEALFELPVLGYLNLAYNNFSGQIMRQITLMTHLTELSLQGNQLTGPIDENLWFLPQLRLLDLSHNKLTGVLTESIGLTFSLAELQLNGNTNLTGPIPPELGILKNFDRLSIDGTGMSCLTDAAEEHGEKEGGDDGGARWPRCPHQQLLPCFLTFTNFSVPLTDSSNVACPVVLRRATPDAVNSCLGDGSWQLGDQASMLEEAGAAAATMGLTQQTWQIDASYYQYQGCECLKGFSPVWANNNTLLTCERDRSSDAKIFTVVVPVVVGAFVVLAIAGVFAWLRMTVQLRPRWQREKELNANRRKGVPCGGPATIVVTDIERYSELMQVNAPLTTRALGLHNAVLRRAAAAHAGHVVEQEGDSWSVAFHSPMDAVAFCLQVQQALEKINWPGDLGLKKRRSSGNTTAAAAGAGGGTSMRESSAHGGSMRSSHSQVNAAGRATSNLQSSPLIAGSGASMSAGLRRGSAGLIQMSNLDETSEAPSSPVSSVVQRDSGSSSQAPVQASGSSMRQQQQQQLVNAGMVGRETSFSSMQSSSSFTSRRSSERSAGQAVLAALNTIKARVTRAGSAGSSGGGDGPHQRGSNSFSRDNIASQMLSNSSYYSGVGEDSTTAAGESVVTARMGRRSVLGGGSSMTSGMPGASTSRFWSIIGFQHGNSSSDHKQENSSMDNVVRGLRVRMGVASGFVPRNTAVTRCALFELTKAVSDMACGGQILLEAGCFDGMRDRLTELGTVDHKGYNDDLLALATKAALRQQTSCLFSLMGCIKRCLGRPDSAEMLDSDALLLDMGEYNQPSLAPIIPIAGGMPLSEPSPGAVVGPSNSGTGARLASATDANNVADAAAAAAAAEAEDAGVSAAASAVFSASGKGAVISTNTLVEAQHLQLFSILPRSLAHRAQYFGSRLTFKEGTRQIRKGYFEAPGTMVIGLSPASTAPGAGDWANLPLPPVSMVFVQVEGGRALVRRRPELGRVVQATMHRLLQVVLASMPERDGLQDGYICREMEGELKYMIAFREPARALEWCLVMQKVMAAVPWPRDLLEEPDSLAASAADALTGGGALLLHGRPLLKMGLAEGQPHSLSPDHMGRADYHGPSVNLAARMMDAAASGGQVVTSVELAERIFSTWRYESELGLYDLPEPEEQPAAAAAAAAAELSAEQQHEQGQQRTPPDAAVGGSPFMQVQQQPQHLHLHPQQQQQQQQQQLPCRPHAAGRCGSTGAGDNRGSSKPGGGNSVQFSDVLYDDLAPRTLSGTQLRSSFSNRNRPPHLSRQLPHHMEQQQQHQQQERQERQLPPLPPDGQQPLPPLHPDRQQPLDQQQQQQQHEHDLSAGQWSQVQSHAQQHQQLQLQPPVSILRTASTEVNGVERSGQSVSRSLPLLPVRESSTATGSAGGFSGPGRPSTRQQLIRNLMHPMRSEMLLSNPTFPQRLVRVTGLHIGTFSFKGCGITDMVTFISSSSPSAMAAAAAAAAAASDAALDPGVSASAVAAAAGPPKDGKGNLVTAKSGPVLGLQDCPVVLPDVLPAFRKAWLSAAAEAAAAEHARMLRKFTAGSSGIKLPGGRDAVGPGTSRGNSATAAGAPYTMFRERPDVARSQGTLASVWPPPSLAPSLAMIPGSGTAGDSSLRLEALNVTGSPRGSAASLALAPRSSSFTGSGVDLGHLLRMGSGRRKESAGADGAGGGASSSSAQPFSRKSMA